MLPYFEEGENASSLFLIPGQLIEQLKKDEIPMSF